MRIQKQHVAARLITLEKMGLAEPVGNNAWLARRDFENILRAMQRVNDRQKMLAAHGALLSDERLQLVVADMRGLKSLEGRVILQAEEEAGREAGQFASRWSSVFTSYTRNLTWRRSRQFLLFSTRRSAMF